MRARFLGHAVVLLEGMKEKYNAIVDPFITGNPVYPTDFELPKIDYVLVTHGHNDHLGDTVELCKKHDSVVISNAEICTYLQLKGCKVHPMHVGGTYTFDFGKVKLTPAFHGSGIHDGANMIYGGNPCGFLINVDEKVIYHAGDTGLTKEMELLKNVDLAFIPIGGNYVMDVDDAIVAVEMFKPKIVVPIHYDTWGVIKADSERFKNEVERFGVECRILRPGECVEL
ncbi:MAG TPA: metal-dependent hydrolase [Fervidobacterium sp.]|nr:metal-dependent hydrolase [Fervidobacterium sp.]HOM74879.1 metal-dependent hydrolase [Fervidobacterium sp.]HQE50378.1 metal-dependent hydrolase [Fervidobacterium sp.]HUM44781.1 metal-dependent hydrolase [Fervidobacterium sp.]